MKKTLAILIGLALALGLCLPACAAQYTIGICQFRPHPALDEATRCFKDAVNAALGEGEVEFLFDNAQGEFAACTAAMSGYVTKGVNLILANATSALEAAANATMEIPVLGVSVTEYGAALHIDDFDGLVGGNISGASDLAPLDEQDKMILSVFPQTQRVGLLYCSGEPNSAYQVKKVREYLEGQGVACLDFPFVDSSDVARVTGEAAKAAQVIFIPTDNVVADCAEIICDVVLPAGVPVMGGDTYMCSACGVATLSVDYYDLGVVTGQMAVKILTGQERIEEMPIAYAPEFLKLYNRDLCQELQVDVAALEAAGYVDLAKIQ